MKHECRKELLYALAAISLPLLVQLTWLLHNTQLPIADADEQLVSANGIYRYFAAHDWLNFFTELYHARTLRWRPISFYLLEVPFQIASSGDLMFTARGVTLLCTAVACLYLYRLLRLATEPAQAVLATAILGLLPTVQWPDTLLAFSTDALLPAILAAMYHFMRSDDFHNRRHRIGFIIAVAVAFAMRPVEAFNHLLLVMVTFLAVSWHRKLITGTELYRIMLGACISASVLALSGLLAHGVTPHSSIFRDPDQSRIFIKIAQIIVISTLALLAGGAARRWRAWHNAGGRISGVEWTFYSIYALILLLYQHVVPQLVTWVYTCSLGSLGAMAVRPPTGEILTGFVMDTGLAPFLGITLIGLLSFVFCLGKEQRRQLLRSPLLYLFALIPPTLLMTLVSVQFLQRKVTIILDVFLLALLIPALMRGRLFTLRNALLLLMAGFQLYGSMTIANADQPNTWLSMFTGSGYPRMVTISPNPNMVMFDFLESAAKRNGYQTILMPIMTDSSLVIDPFLLSMLVGNLDNGIEAGFPYEPSYNATTPPRFLAGKGDAFLLINALEGRIRQSAEDAARLREMSAKASDPNDKLRFDLQALYADGKFGDMGITKKDCMIIEPFNREACLFEKRTCQITAITGNICGAGRQAVFRQNGLSHMRTPRSPVPAG